MTDLVAMMSRKGLLSIFLILYFQTGTKLFASTLSVTSDGSDGSFAPVASTTLSLDNGLTFNFTDIQIDSGVTVAFNQTGLAVNFLGTSDIFITGTLDASLLDLKVTTPGSLTVDGELLAGSLYLEANDIFISGILSVQNNISLLAENSTSVDQNAGITSNDVTLTSSEISTIGQSSNGGTILIGESGVVLLPSTPITLVPIPAASWLFCSGLLGLIGIAGRKKP